MAFYSFNLLGLALKARPKTKALFASFLALVISVASGDASDGYSLQHFLYAAREIKATDAIEKTPGSLTCLGSAVSRCLNLGFWTGRQGGVGGTGLPLCRPNAELQ